MSHQSLRSLCILSALLILTFSGCRSGEKKQATIDPPQAPQAEMESSSPLLPPMPSLGGSRPRLLPGGPDSPLEAPPRYRSTSPTGRSALGGPSLPLPAPPAEDF
jgi:hypothetical protein